MTAGSELEPGQHAGSERDALAIVAAFVNNDMEAVQLISRNSRGNAVITDLLNLLFLSYRTARLTREHR